MRTDDEHIRRQTLNQTEINGVDHANDLPSSAEQYNRQQQIGNWSDDGA